MTYFLERIERAYPWLLLAPVILPVVIWGGLIYPYLVPKTLLFYALSFIAMGAFALLAAHERAFFWGRLAHKETWIPALLLALAYIASIAGFDFYRSFWSLFVRGDGLLMLTCAVSSFYLILLYADRAFFERLLRLVAIVGSFVAAYGIGEWLFGGGRIGSLLGNAAFFAGYLGITFFATLAAAHALSGGWRRAANVGAALQVIAIVLTATRGTMLALFVAGGVALAYIALRNPGAEAAESKKEVRLGRAARSAPFFGFAAGAQRIWATGVLLALVATGGLFFAFRAEIAKMPFAPAARIASIGANDPDVASRLFIWKNMLGEIEKSPWLGVGTEHIDVLFNRFYDPTLIQEQWFDRSHNAFLDYAAQYGIGGLLLYLALIASFFVAARRSARDGDTRLAGLFALLAITYAVQNVFVFDTISSFWLLLALLAAYLSVSFGDGPSRSVLPLLPWIRSASWVFALVLALLIIPASVRPALAAYDLSEAYKYQLIDVSKEVTYLSHGMALGTYGDLEYGYEAYDMYANDQATALSGDARVAGYQAALSILTDDFNRYTYDARTALYLAHVLSLAPPGITVDKNLLSASLERAIRLSPKRSQPWYVLVNLSISEANTHPVGSPERASGYAAARDILARYIALVPTLAEPHFVLAQLDFAAGDTAAASAEAAKGKESYTSDLETARRAVGYYENIHDWQNALFFLKEVVQLDPQDTVSQYDLAKVTYLSGDPAGAVRIVEGLRKTDPAILGTDQNFLAAITAYESR
ncbi:O-antigen ligase family protein [Patescibacteria group bacterium]|nr:O-antigen ligase family protein [Patescibacteria group bacterium]